jgi:hypothetical protein
MPDLQDDRGTEEATPEKEKKSIVEKDQSSWCVQEQDQPLPEWTHRLIESFLLSR